MTDIQKIESLDEAIRIISKSRLALAGGAENIWAISFHAENHLNKQVRSILLNAGLREEKEVVTCG